MMQKVHGMEGQGQILHMNNSENEILYNQVFTYLGIRIIFFYT